MILYACDDLIWASRIRAAAEAVGLRALRVRDPDALASHLENPGLRGILVDLADMQTARPLLTRLHADDRHTAIPIVAFGPHVDAESLNEAKRLGAHQVFTRAAMQRRLPNVLEAWASQSLDNQPPFRG